MKTCERAECGVQFKPGRKTQRFCTADCRIKDLRSGGVPSTKPEYYRKYRKENLDILRGNARRYVLRSTFGITPEQYDEMAEMQRGVCAICGKTEECKNRRLAVDHDHVTGKNRGLLCFKCNRALGGFGDDIDRLKKAIEYLEAHKMHGAPRWKPRELQALKETEKVVQEAVRV